MRTAGGPRPRPCFATACPLGHKQQQGEEPAPHLHDPFGPFKNMSLLQRSSFPPPPDERKRTKSPNQTRQGGQRQQGGETQGSNASDKGMLTGGPKKQWRTTANVRTANKPEQSLPLGAQKRWPPKYNSWNI